MMAAAGIIYSVCVGGPSGFGLLADWLLYCGGGVSFGATANCKGGRGGVPVIIDVTCKNHIEVFNQSSVITAESSF